MLALPVTDPPETSVTVSVCAPEVLNAIEKECVP